MAIRLPSLIALALCAGIHQASAAQSGVYRPPCVAPGTPYGCDSVPGAPQPLGSNQGIPEYEPLVQLPMDSPPEKPAQKNEPQGDVSVKQLPADNGKTMPGTTSPDTVGPQR